MADLISMLAAAAGAGGEDVDPDFANTVLLLHGDGTNGAQNNTFLDSSTNNFTITRNGNTTQGSFTPFSKPDGRFGNFFDGSGDYLSSTSVALITSAVTTFTVEAWVYLTATPPSDANNISAFCTLDGQPTGPTNYMSFGPKNDGKLYLFWFDGAVKSATGTTVLSLNTWYHIACVVNSNSIQFYIDGVADAMGGTTTLTTRSGTQGNFAIGSSSAGVITGYISNFRVTTTAVYTAAFTPSGPLTNITNTKILTCQSNRFIDNSTNAYALTANGDVKVTPFSPFPITTEYSPSVNGGSGYFDGSGDYLAFGPTSNIGTGQFTIEAWVYFTLSPSSRGLWGTDKSTSGGFTIRVNSTTNVTLDVTGGGGTSFTVPTININEWTHIACVRDSSNNTTVFVNGQRASTGAVTVTTSFDYLAGLGLIYPTTQNSVYGYIASARILTGSAIYDPTQTTCTVPTSPLTAVSGTQFLCNFTNAGIFDNTGFNNLETVADAQIDTTTKKYGTGSMEFDGTGDNLTIASNPSVWFGSGPFTIEMWLYPNNAASEQMLVSGSDTGGLFLGMNIDGANRIALGRKGVGVDNQVSYTYSTGAWIHLACTRDSSNNVRFYVDGTQVGSTGTNSNSFANSALNIAFEPTQKYLNGFIDDLRITKLARYTGASFTPPTEAFPNIGA
jgi:hypothetical protein